MICSDNDVDKFCWYCLICYAHMNLNYTIFVDFFLYVKNIKHQTLVSFLWLTSIYFYIVQQYRITGNFFGFRLKRRHLIFADFFSSADWKPRHRKKKRKKKKMYVLNLHCIYDISCCHIYFCHDFFVFCLFIVFLREIQNSRVHPHVSRKRYFLALFNRCTY